MFHRCKLTCRLEHLLATFLLYGLFAGWAPTTLGEIVVPLEPGQEIVTLDTRPGVTMRVLLVKPDAAPNGIFILFPGGNGQLMGRSGRIGREFGRLGAAHLFAEQGFIAAVVDAPSDQAGELSSRFRTSNEHVEDARKIIDFLGQKWSKPSFLMGHSRGTLSVAHLAGSLKDSRIEGIVLTGSLAIKSKAGYFSLSELRMDQITIPVLFVHHREDGCPTTPFDVAVQLQNRLANSRRIGFIEVLGGEGGSPDPCSGRSYGHGFSGKEREVVKAITDWAMGKPIPDRIGP